ncbi:hypothetical protein TBLA_0B01470 [Henningerozyma blattae CBS 6284]|uniref:Ribose-5-phosphate isomerase n=1 Tax=Henningerozyma blattae (strain ATCC 34711 / CBS 6284 / DSM 70876 / NBRC 10599 / NRRL Y-10934 / UCD 77-7) TaxID=1071380 RepID=I2GXY8_HENB6|nr:hypothetical protein TBLA_0B01470 [Tetrapisispora blattae CBS 6284]CCH58990.1 hypothetical protein TBLA_0B01470 [Tetrapisispora blattae CBS 6284]
MSETTNKPSDFALPDVKDLKPLDSEAETAKRLAAYRAVDKNIDFENHRIIGIGSGSTVVYVAERLGQYLLDPKYKPFVEKFICIPTGFQSIQLILDNGLQLGSIERNPVIDIAFDGADEVDTNLQLIKGGGACLFQEKLVSTSSKKFIIVADYRKWSPTSLGVKWTRGVPLEVVPSAYVRVKSDLINKLNCKKVVLRQGGSAKAGPVVTDNNNFILDADFGPIKDPKSLHVQLKLLLGIVETGLFIDNADIAYIGNSDGTVLIAPKS